LARPGRGKGGWEFHERRGGREIDDFTKKSIYVSAKGPERGAPFRNRKPNDSGVSERDKVKKEEGSQA